MSPLEGPPRKIDIQEMRGFRRERLTHRAVVIEIVSTRVSLGFAQSEVAVARDVPCLYQPTGGTIVSRESGAIEEVSRGVCTFDANENVQPNHRLYVTGRMNNVAFAKRLAVLATNIPRSQGVAMKADVTDDESLAGAGPPPA